MSNDWLPAGLFDLANQLGDALNERVGFELVPDAQPLVEMPSRLGEAPAANEPIAWGDGFLCVDLGPDDSQTWQTFAEVNAQLQCTELVAAEAQLWRLPVTPFRRPAQLPSIVALPGRSTAGRPCAAQAAQDLEGFQIVDLTSIWAGPLCTHLLARAGASVTKVDSDVRPDGLRGTRVYDELNHNKQIVDLNLQDPTDRKQFDQLVARADLLVTSLSPRALGNLELMPAHSPSGMPSRSLAITAFGCGTPEAEWIAYGTGVHAASGLAWSGPSDARNRLPQIPSYSYPDPLAGLAACAVALDQLDDRAPRNSRVSLAEAIAPLASHTQQTQ